MPQGGLDGSLHVGQLWIPTGELLEFASRFAGVVATVVWSIVLTFIIIKVTQAVTGLRVSDEQIADGLDMSAHGERGYSL